MAAAPITAPQIPGFRFAYFFIRLCLGVRRVFLLILPPRIAALRKNSSATRPVTLVVRTKQMVPVFPFLAAPRKRGSGAAALSGPPPVQARGKLWVPAFAGKTEKECGYQMFNSHH